MTELKLKPCPFCGSEKVGMSKGLTTSWLHYNYRGNIRAIVCGNCGCCGGIFNTKALDEDVAEEKAVESWNRRANDAWEIFAEIELQLAYVKCADSAYERYLRIGLEDIKKRYTEGE